MDQEIESRVLTLEEDMANNPGKTKAQVKYARRYDWKFLAALFLANYKADFGRVAW
jgi:hypothetical protein